MRFAMTDNYAALVMSVDAGLLVVGAVQSHGTVTTVRERIRAVNQRHAAAMRVIADRLRAGEEPTNAELHRAHDLSRKATGDLRRRFERPATVGLMWAIMSVWLVVSVVATLWWSAMEGHGRAPWLAEGTLAATALATLVLLAETILRFCWAGEAATDDLEQEQLQRQVAAVHMDAELPHRVRQRLDEFARGDRR
ncbi:hypothetical protein [Streptomyces sp. NRRL S-337]|uniref:hypothetical protein n=1 Tax=Streptomyces sp. NRRL S-337 TaxID=1463900 RepID=UPI0004C81E6A|nr:hypothetical protein [Streptomyces sp. NRRL S-337]